MKTTRPTLQRDFSSTTVPQAYASPASTQSSIFGSASPSSPGMASPSSTLASTTPTSPGRLRRANAPTYIAMPMSSPPATTTRNRARSNTLNTPLVFDAGGTVVFGIRTPAFEARTPAADSPDGRPAHRAGLATLNRVVSNEPHPTTMPRQSYFDNVNIYGPVKCRMPINRFTTRDREMFWSLDCDSEPPAMSRDASPDTTPFTPETPRRP